MEQVVINAKTLARVLTENGINLVTGGTDNHLVLLDLRGTGVTGLELEQRLQSVGIITNKNAIPFDTEKKTITSGVRLGTPAITSRGLKQKEVEIVGEIIVDTIKNYENTKEHSKAKVRALCDSFPLYKE